MVGCDTDTRVGVPWVSGMEQVSGVGATAGAERSPRNVPYDSPVAVS